MVIPRVLLKQTCVLPISILELRDFTTSESVMRKDPLADIGLILQEIGVPMILWGELAMRRHKIQTVLFVIFKFSSPPFVSH
jgi:hypothetical protein